MKIFKRAKIVPFLIFTAIFVGILATQIALNNFKLVAGPTTLESNRLAHLEHEYKTLKLTDQNGLNYEVAKSSAKIVIINFWAAWCSPCLEELPGLVQLQKKFTPGEVAIYGVNEDVEDQDKNITRIAKKYVVEFPIIPDRDSLIANKLFIANLPQTLIFKDGKLIDLIQGQKDFAAVEFIESLKSAIKH